MASVGNIARLRLLGEEAACIIHALLLALPGTMAMVVHPSGLCAHGGRAGRLVGLVDLSTLPG